jgi:hypothetical protein
MRRARTRGGLGVIALLALTGCTISGRIPEGRAQRGPAWMTPHRIVALPPRLELAESMENPSPELSPERIAEAVASHVRLELAARGVTIVDAESLNGRTRERVEERTRSADRDWTTRVELGSGGFLESPPDVQRAVLDELQIDAILHVEVRREEPHTDPRAGTQEQTVRLVMRLSRLVDDAVIAEGRCDADSGAYARSRRALDQATRCATDALLLALRQGP